MTRFLLWNLKRKPLQKLIANLARNYNVDVVILLECVIPPATLLLTLNQSGKNLYDYDATIGCDKVTIFTRFPRHFIPPILESSRLTIRHLQLPGCIDILVAATHFPSKANWSASSQATECTELANLVRKAEATVGHSRTVLVGDLNMNPFEEGIINANGLHGVMSQRVAERKTRVVQSKEYPFFYNPMWGLFGDSDSSPPGTFYYSRAEHTTFFWNMFDQVLIRPDLIDKFDNSELKILCSDGETSFLTAAGIPNSKIASDHLPILFELNL